MKEYRVLVGEKEITIKPNSLAEQSNGSVFVQYGDTVVFSAVTMSRKVKEDMDFFPMVVDFEEKFYASGKIGGSRYTRREGKSSDAATITSRLIDRALRPAFPKNLKGREVQIISTCFSWDEENAPDILGLVSSSVALMISDIPFNGPVGAVRVGIKDNQFIANPTYIERKNSPIDVVFTGVKDGNNISINMIDGDFKESKNSIIHKAFIFAKEYIGKLCDIQEEITREIGQKKIEIEPVVIDELFKKEISEIVGGDIVVALSEKDKARQLDIIEKLKERVSAVLQKKYPDDREKIKQFFLFIEDKTEEIIKKEILSGGSRPDGREVDQLREIEGRVGVLPRLHGVGLFSRGQTKVLSTLTLGPPGDYQLIESMEGPKEKRFIHHYNFLPYSVGEIKSMRGPSRRDIGHGTLSERAIVPILPSIDDFPYTIRVVSEILSSNGSTSMASICSTSLALMDAGVPIKKPVAGISIGIIQNKQNMEYKLLTDIQGLEDHYGGMDLKVAGTDEGVTVIQMDSKIRGIDDIVFNEALDRAEKTRLKILGKMKEVLGSPRENLSKYAPRVISFKINPDKIKEVIGPGGKVINEIIDKTGATIDIQDSGVIFITSNKKESAEKAVKWVKSIVREVEIGEIFKGEVKRILDFGAFVEILPGQDGLVHVSKLSNDRVDKVEDIVKVGEIVSVKVVGIDNQGRISLSIKDAY